MRKKEWIVTRNLKLGVASTAVVLTLFMSGFQVNAVETESIEESVVESVEVESQANGEEVVEEELESQVTEEIISEELESQVSEELESLPEIESKEIIESVEVYPESAVSEIESESETVEEDQPEAASLRVATNPKVIYSTHVQSYGWQDSVSEGQASGTTGEAKRLEGIKIDIKDNDLSGGIEYRTHVEKYGWMNWVSTNQMSGTEGEAKRLEAIEIKLTGELSQRYDVYYRVHAEKFGWLDWAKNGQPAGTAGYAYRLEAIEIKLVEKGQTGPSQNMPAFKDKADIKVPSVTYQTHVQSIGWQKTKKDGQTSGTSGLAKRLEAIKIGLSQTPYSGGITYRTHVEKYGWMNWAQNFSLSGTENQAKRLEAIEIKLTGNMANYFDVYYRVHAESFGWLGWAKNGQSAGTAGYAKRLEAIEIKLVEKGKSAPGSTTMPFRKKVVTSKPTKDILAIDTDRNGIVTIKEAKAAGFKMPIYKDHWLYPYMIDRDGDGKVGE